MPQGPADRAPGRLPAWDPASRCWQRRRALLLSGNCTGTLGVLAGLSGPAGPAGRRVGLLWLDAHGDFNTPDEDGAGFLDGQGPAIAVGRCWAAAAAGIPGFAPPPERDVVLIGARDLTGSQQDVLEASGITWLRPAQARDPEAIGTALDEPAGRVDVVHFHVDLDVHDPSIAPANGDAGPDGLTAAEVRRVLHLAAGRLPVVSAWRRSPRSPAPRPGWRGKELNRNTAR